MNEKESASKLALEIALQIFKERKEQKNKQKEFITNQQREIERRSMINLEASEKTRRR